MVATRVLDGPMTAARFPEYVAGVLVPALRPGDRVVLDNLPCHTSAAVLAAVEAAGCRLVFLPPYSPDLNPIALAFARLKRLLRSDGHRTVPTVVSFLESVGRAFRAGECRAYIRHCGHGQPPATPPPNRRYCPTGLSARLFTGKATLPKPRPPGLGSPLGNDAETRCLAVADSYE